MPSNQRVTYLREGTPLPPVSYSRNDGLLAAGGDLGIPRLLEAYGKGIFPWYDDESPILWYSPLIRCVIYPGEFVVSHSLRSRLRKNEFSFNIDSCFEDVIDSCATVARKGLPGTWITREMKHAYVRLYHEGYAHSLEVFKNDKLVGGLYGVSLGRAFFGESMFHIETDASKAALYYLCKWAETNQFHFIDAQMPTNHLVSLGATVVPRNVFIEILNKALQFPTLQGQWKCI